MTRQCSPPNAASGQAARRVTALVRKERYSSFRDPSSIAIGVVMPADADPAVRLRAVARREERSGRGRAREPSPTARSSPRASRSRPISTRKLTRRCRGRRSCCCSKVDGIVRLRRISPGSSAAGSGAGADSRQRHRRQPCPHHPGLRPGRDRASGGATAPPKGIRHRGGGSVVVQTGCGSTRPTTATISWCPA